MTLPARGTAAHAFAGFSTCASSHIEGTLEVVRDCAVLRADGGHLFILRIGGRPHPAPFTPFDGARVRVTGSPLYAREGEAGDLWMAHAGCIVKAPAAGARRSPRAGNTAAARSGGIGTR